MRVPHVVALSAVLSLALAAPAVAAQRHAAAGSATASGACGAGAPCTLEYAVGGAATGDEVVVGPGVYSLSNSLTAPVSLNLHGAAGEPRPRLIGGSGLTAATLSFKVGGSVRHLSIESTAPDESALVLQNAVGEDLTLTAVGGETAKVVASPSVTVLRDSLLRMTGDDSDDSALKLTDGNAASGGDLAILNATVDATAGQAIGVRCLTNSGQTTIANAIVRGASHDIDASTTGSRCAVDHSDFRTLTSPGVSSGAGNISADPGFGDAAAGNYRPLAGAPGIDAGAPNARLGTVDLDAHARTLGAAPDMGAYELDAASPPSASSAGAFPPLPATTPAGSATSGDAPAATTDAAPATTAPSAPHDEPVLMPQVAQTVVVAPSSGTVLIRRPGAAGDVPLGAGATIPVGSVIDATKGTVVLQSALDATGRTQKGEFSGGRFQVRQPASGHGMTELVLTGGSFAGCGKAAPRTAAVAARKRPPVRRLWGKDDHGTFRTRGRVSVATVRGTKWLTEDRCEGTLTRVAQGAVDVRDVVRGTHELVKAGHELLVAVKRRPA